MTTAILQDTWITAYRRRDIASGRAFLSRVADRYFARKGTNARIGIGALDAYKVAYELTLLDACPWGEAGTWKS